jgi:hypothetical protein
MAANAFYVWLVFQRHDKAAAGDWAGFARMERRQHKIGALVLGAILTALAAGLVHDTGASQRRPVSPVDAVFRSSAPQHGHTPSRRARRCPPGSVE